VTSSSKKSTDPCKVCQKAVTRKDKSILCDFCELWMHQACSKLDDHTFEVLSNCQQLYFCQTCLPLAKRFIDMEKRVDHFEARMETLEKRLEKLETAGPNRPPPLMSFPINPPPMQGTFDAQKEQMRDELERQSKRKNAVLFGLQVSSRNDTDIVKELIEEAEIEGLSPDDIVTVFRDGPSYDDKPRFCKVYCVSIECKTRFINFVNSSRKSGVEGFSSMRARPDLSFLQRKTARDLRAEMKTRTDNGELNLFIDYKNECIKQGRERRVI
jgi:PHD-finger